VPLERRPEGSRLLQDAEAGRFGSVVIYRLDRLGRDLRVTMDAHDALQIHGVALRSSTEQLDTSSPNGRMIFQIMGSFSELEKSTITERTVAGRRRVAREGRYTGGAIPLGYDVDEHKRFIPSARIVPTIGMTEAELVRDIFQRIADGATLTNVAAHLTALGVSCHARYGGSAGKIVEATGRWSFSSLGKLLHNPAYKGEGIFRWKGGEVIRPMPVLVDRELWQRAQDAMTRNRSLSRKNAKRDYWLRGLIHCGTCGAAYIGTTSNGTRKYRCSAHRTNGVLRIEPCRGRILHADWIEQAVWAECVRFIEHPGDALEEAKHALRASMGEAASVEAQRQTVLGQLSAKDQERERILTLYRRGVISDIDTEHQLVAITREARQLKEVLESMKAQAALLEA
jgi:site-specific DNA recombinase